MEFVSFFYRTLVFVYSVLLKEKKKLIFEKEVYENEVYIHTIYIYVSKKENEGSNRNWQAFF
jgi:hypothetical protein